MRIIAAALIFLALAPAAQASHRFNIRYLLVSKAMLDINLGSYLSIGPTFQSVSASESLSTGSSTRTTTVGASTVGGRATIHLQGRGMEDGWYFAGEGGTVKINATRTTTGAADFKGETTGTYAEAFLGYHWYWSVFNLNLGFGSGTWSINSLSITDGTTTESYSFPKLSGSGLELGIGLAF